MANKGSPFEREIARKLSLWWSGGASDELFWRVMGSGGRATRRSRTGKAVAHQSFGDIEATCPEGKPLTDCLVIELKRGYGRWAVEDVLDNKTPATQTWAKFVKQVVESWRASGRLWWCVIYKRDQRQTMIAICPELFLRLAQPGGSSTPQALKFRKLPSVYLKNDGDRSCAIMRLDTFFAVVPPTVFIEAAAQGV